MPGNSAASCQKKKHDFPIARDGGLQQAEQFLGLREIKDFDPSLDVIFVSIDLEVSRQERPKPGVPLVKEFGIATFDTRHLRCSPFPSIPTKSISSRQYSTSHASKDFFGCDVTDFRECVFAETEFVSQRNLPTTITKSLRIQDDIFPDSQDLRNIVLIGHSIKHDVKILQRLGINVYEVAPVVAILDTYLITRNLPTLRANMSSLQLSALLTELNCPFESLGLRDAGSDATCALHAMLMLATKSAERRECEMDFGQRENLQCLRTVAQMELYECPRWKPNRRSLGFYAPEPPVEGNLNINKNPSNRWFVQSI